MELYKLHVRVWQTRARNHCRSCKVEVKTELHCCTANPRLIHSCNYSQNLNLSTDSSISLSQLQRNQETKPTDLIQLKNCLTIAGASMRRCAAEIGATVTARGQDGALGAQTMNRSVFKAQRHYSLKHSLLSILSSQLQFYSVLTLMLDNSLRSIYTIFPSIAINPLICNLYRDDKHRLSPCKLRCP